MNDKASLIRGAFLFCVSHTGDVTISAEFAGVSPSHIREMMAQDAAFAKAVDGALCEAEDRVFYHALRRALDGQMISHYYQGEIVGYVARRSDSLLRYVLYRLQTRGGALAEAINGSDDTSQDVQSARARLKARLMDFAAQDEKPVSVSKDDES